MKKFNLKNSIITKCFSAMIIVNIIMAIISLLVQNFYMENIYFHSRINSIEKNLIEFKNVLINEPKVEIDKNNMAKTFYNQNNVEVMILDENLNVVDDSVFEDFNYLLVKDGKDNYKRIFIDFLLDDQGKSISYKLNNIISSEVNIKGVSIGGTNYIDAVEVSIDGNIYTNYNAYWEWDDSYVYQENQFQNLKAEIIDVRFNKVDGGIANQGKKLWNNIKINIYSKMTTEELKNVVETQGETTYFDTQSKLQVYYKIDYVKNRDGKYLFFAMLFTLEDIQPAFRVLNNYYFRQYLFMIIIIVFMGYMLGKKFKKPMEQLNDYAKDIAMANFHSTLDIKTNDETGELCYSLNQISKNLSHKINEINNRALEKEKEEKRLRMLLASMSHEFKTPLGIISGFIQMIKDGIKKEREDYYLEVIDDEINGLNSLVLETIELTNYESGAAKVILESFDIKRCIEVISKKFSNELEKKNLDIIINVKECYVIGDIKKIERVIYNFISNAIKYSSDCESIYISTEDRINHIYIYFDNIGAKIPNDEINKIWDIFYRVDESRNRLSGGSGLGLAIVKNILELHCSDKGAINLENGVRMYFSLKKDTMEI